MSSNTPLYDVFEYLTSVSSLDLTSGSNFFLSLMVDDPIPEEPDDVVVVTEHPGVAPDWTMGSALPAVEEISVQIISRMNESGYNTNADRIWAIYRACSVVVNQTINDTLYLWWEPIHTPAFLHRDEKRRIYHVFSFAPMRQPN